MNMTKSIKIAVKNVYGRETLYPACKLSEFFCSLAGTRTITTEMMRLIRAQGFAIEVATKAVSFA